jgi:hypothetical protein
MTHASDTCRYRRPDSVNLVIFRPEAAAAMISEGAARTVALFYGTGSVPGGEAAGC